MKRVVLLSATGDSRFFDKRTKFIYKKAFLSAARAAQDVPVFRASCIDPDKGFDCMEDNANLQITTFTLELVEEEVADEPNQA